MKAEGLKILGKLEASSKTRERRLTTLIRSPDEADGDWFMHVPVSFNNALDIRRTERVGSLESVWTQGGNFSFAIGDTIYDTPRAYERWADALQHIGYCITVSQATAVSPPTVTTPRHSGYVGFNLSAPDASKTALTAIRAYAMTQDEFVRFLITGPPVELQLA